MNRRYLHAGIIISALLAMAVLAAGCIGTLQTPGENSTSTPQEESVISHP